MFSHTNVHIHTYRLINTLQTTPEFRERSTAWQKFSKISSTPILHSKSSNTATFENFDRLAPMLNRQLYSHHRT